MDQNSSFALRQVFNDIVETNDEFFRIVHTHVTEEMRDTLRNCGVHYHKVERHVIVPSLDLEYIIYLERHTKKRRMFILSKSRS